MRLYSTIIFFVILLSPIHAGDYEHIQMLHMYEYRDGEIINHQGYLYYVETDEQTYVEIVEFHDDIEIIVTKIYRYDWRYFFRSEHNYTETYEIIQHSHYPKDSLYSWIQDDYYREECKFIRRYDIPEKYVVARYINNIMADNLITTSPFTDHTKTFPMFLYDMRRLIPYYDKVEIDSGISNITSIYEKNITYEYNGEFNYKGINYHRITFIDAMKAKRLLIEISESGDIICFINYRQKLLWLNDDYNMWNVEDK